VNAGRRNVDITYVVFNNSVYGLTKGQASPTLRKGLKTKSMPEAAIQDGINPLAVAVSSGYTFVARAFALDPRTLASLIAAGVRHRGSSFIDVLQTCPTYNDLYTSEWYNHTASGAPRIYRLAETGYDGRVKDPGDAEEVVAKKVQAIAKSYEWGERIPVGVYYECDLPTYEDALAERNPRYGRQALVDTDFSDRDLTPLLDALR
jgi:2-oxoglutarate ferredoxin oxidoreductase subunit beta